MAPHFQEELLNDRMAAKQIMRAQTFYECAYEFLGNLERELDERKIRWPDHWDVDHLCYRVETQARYLEMKAMLGNLGQLLAETDVNGRPISTFKLFKPVQWSAWDIDLLELPAPKPFKTTVEGFEHIEVVADESFDQLHRRFLDADFDHGGMRKPFNAELELKVGPFAVKFHHLSLESVVRLESHPRAWHALRESRVLENLMDHGPQVAGTFPLGLDHPESDLDILFRCEDFTTAAARIQGFYGHAEGFELKRTIVNGDPALIARFKILGVPFELFGQNLPALEQRAYRHFLAEERLLKYGGPLFVRKVKAARAAGAKTEPAFLEVLGLPGDPYQRLLEFQRMTASDLRDRLI